jgi:excisionase family DNA binding protein
VTDLRQLVDETPLEELPSLVGRLREAELLAEMRLRGEASGNGSRPEPEDRNLSADEAAQRLGLSRDYLYRNANKLPFTVRIGTRVLFSARGLDRWNRARTGR